MKVECSDLENILERRRPEEMAALEAHAAACPACRRQLEIDREIAAAARAMRKKWESPALWARIEKALAAEAARPRAPEWKRWFLLPGAELSWRTAAAVAVLIAVTVTGTWLAIRQAAPTELWRAGAEKQEERRLLTEQALRNVETSEAAYVKSIETLSALAEPRLNKADSPLLLSYREKLLMLDAAIAECRARAERNRFNAHLRQELLSIYQDKQHTLQQLVREN